MRVVSEIINKDPEYYSLETAIIVDPSDEVDEWYGLSHIRITDKELQALKNGKCLYWNDGEYATVVSYQQGEEE